MKRLFIAVPISEQTRTEIMKGILSDEAALKMPVRWTSFQNMHLTLQFLGDVETRRIPDLKSVLNGIQPLEQETFLEFTGIGAFPNKSAPRVIWLGIRENAALKTRQMALTDVLIKKGFSADQKPFKPHLTLGRVKNDAEVIPDTMTALIRLKDRITVSPSKLDRITLFESQLRPGGPIYTAVYEKKLFS